MKCLFCGKQAAPLQLATACHAQKPSFCSVDCAASWATWEVYHRRVAIRRDKAANTPKPKEQPK